MKFTLMVIVLMNLAMQMLAEENAEEAEKEQTEEVEEAEEGQEGEEEGGEGEKEVEEKEQEEGHESVSKGANSEVKKNCNKQAELNFVKCVIWNHSVTFCEREKAQFLHRCLPRHRKEKKTVSSREYAEVAKNCYKQADNNFNQCVIWNLGTKMCTVQRNTYLSTCLPRKKPKPQEDTRALRTKHNKETHMVKFVNTPIQDSSTADKVLKFQKIPTVELTTESTTHRAQFINSKTSQKDRNVVDVVTNSTGSKDPEIPPVDIIPLHILRPVDMKSAETKVEDTTSKPNAQSSKKEHDKFSFLDKMETSEELEW